MRFNELVNISSFLTKVTNDFHDTKLDEWKTVLDNLISQVQDISTLYEGFRSEIAASG